MTTTASGNHDDSSAFSSTDTSPDGSIGISLDKTQIIWLVVGITAVTIGIVIAFVVLCCTCRPLNRRKREEQAKLGMGGYEDNRNELPGWNPSVVQLQPIKQQNRLTRMFSKRMASVRRAPGRDEERGVGEGGTRNERLGIPRQ